MAYGDDYPGWAVEPVRRDYAALKRRSAAEHADDREAYGDAETAFVLRATRSRPPR